MVALATAASRSLQPRAHPFNAKDFHSLTYKTRSFIRLHQQAGYETVRMTIVLGQPTRKRGQRWGGHKLIPRKMVQFCSKELAY